MADIFNMKDDIVKVMFYLNLVQLIIAIFVSSKIYFMSVIVINLILSGTFMVICKYSKVFQKRTGMFGNWFVNLDKMLNNLTNMGNKNG